MANCLSKLGRLDNALELRREIYESKAGTPYDRCRARSAAVTNFAVALYKAKQFAESRALLLEEMPEALRFYGPDDPDYLYMRYVFARVIILHKGLAVKREAVQIIEDVYLTSRRVLGPSHPKTEMYHQTLQPWRERLAQLEASSG